MELGEDDEVDEALHDEPARRSGRKLTLVGGRTCLSLLQDAMLE
jgi:hypothetical protein